MTDTVTLEVYVDQGGTMRHGITQALPELVTATIHAREVIADHLEALPLCWVADGKQRPEPATVGDWEVAFDHEALPGYAVIDGPAFVTCTDCKEWMHA